MPDRVQERLITTYGLTRDEARTLSLEQDLAQFFETAAAGYPHPRKAATWIISQLVPALRDPGRSISDTCLTPDRFTALLGLLDADEINAAAAKAVLVQMLTDDQPPEAIVDAGGFRQVSDTRALERL
jgi:aspartyl-tRNA(Asn)/glutamyl-tRNA(Gln) amidotransferase subunit B